MKVKMWAVAVAAAGLLMGPMSVTAYATAVDGFNVTLNALPTSDVLPTPSATTGHVLVLVGTPSPDFDPFYNISGLAGVSSYLSIQNASSVTFQYSTPKNSFKLLWGTPDYNNTISFYGKDGHLIGALSGADLQTAYGFSQTDRPFPVGSDDYLTIASSMSFYTVTLSEGNNLGCCFEVSDVSAAGIENAVPEPATWAMLLLGMGGMGLAARGGRRRIGSALAVA